MALWAVWHSTDFVSCVVGAVNLLGDADTIGAIAGQLAGAMYSWQGINASDFGRLCLKKLKIWDPYAEVGLRAALLFEHGPCGTITDVDAGAKGPPTRSAVWR